MLSWWHAERLCNMTTTNQPVALSPLIYHTTNFKSPNSISNPNWLYNSIPMRPPELFWFGQPCQLLSVDLPKLHTCITVGSLLVRPTTIQRNSIRASWMGLSYFSPFPLTNHGMTAIYRGLRTELALCIIESRPLAEALQTYLPTYKLTKQKAEYNLRASRDLCFFICIIILIFVIFHYIVCHNSTAHVVVLA